MQIMETNEIEEMRSQISLLRNKLEKQQIINDTILAAAIKSNVAAIEWRMRIPLAAGVFALIFCPIAFGHILHVSKPFIIFTELMLAFEMAGTLWLVHLIPTAADRGADIAEFVRRLDRFDGTRKRQLIAGMILCAVFFAWFMKDLSANYTAEEFYGMLVSVSIGAVAGLAVGLKNYFGISRRLRELRRDADMLRQE